MNRLAIQTEIINLRFNNDATKAAQVLNWIALAEAEVWNIADWNFKRVAAENLTVSNGVATMSSLSWDFSKGIAVYDPSGVPLTYLRPDDFEYAYRVGNPSTGSIPYAWTAIDSQIYVGPAVSGTFKCAYRRGVVHKNSGGSVLKGVMSSDTDTPYWKSEYHYVLVPAAIAIGEVLENDPTSVPYEQMKQTILQQMMSEHVGQVEKQIEYWGDPPMWYYR